MKPIFTMGEYYEENQRIILPLSIQVHHAVCEGFHICCFVNKLQELKKIRILFVCGYVPVCNKAKKHHGYVPLDELVLKKAI